MEKVNVVTANKILIKAYIDEVEAQNFKEELQQTFDNNSDKDKVFVEVQTIELG